MTFLDKIFKKFNVRVLYVALFIIIVAFGWCYYNNRNVNEDNNATQLEKDIKANKIKTITYEPVYFTDFLNLIVTQEKDGEKILYFNIPKNFLFDDKGKPIYPSEQVKVTAKDPRLHGGYEIAINVTSFVFKILMFYCFYLLFSDALEQFGKEVFAKKGVKSRKLVVPNKRFTFKDVAGAEEEKEEMSELIDFLKNPSKYAKMGARIPKGVLLYGPPGTGKTLLAKAVAGEAGVPFFAAAGSDFDEVYVGLGASRIRDLFKEAQLSAPCIVFIDEIEAVAKKRGSVMTSGGSDQTLNQLLVEMDGFNQKKGVIVIAATNRPETLDTAILRPGRFDRHFNISLPNVVDREAILKLHASNKTFSDEVHLGELAKQTPGFSGAQLEGILNEAALLAARKNAAGISKKDISEALDRVLMGPAKKSKKYNEKEKRMVAYHEAGHAVIGLKLPNSQIVQKITIIPRGNAGGYNLMMPEKETFFSSKKTLLAQITSFLGGRVAEEMMFDDVSSGSYSDFKEATKIAKLMVTKYGMSDLGLVQYSGNDFQNDFSDTKGLEIDQQIHKIISNCYEEAKKIIQENKNLLDVIASYLLEMETLTKKDIDEIVATNKISWWEEEKNSKKPQETQEEQESDQNSENNNETVSDNIDASSLV
ncbi:ATP-dependent Zn protease [Candidatus Phytoplasma australiense]|uniref:ATP-dependent zinc metalloprotease FtsH n=1 Tax=Phytoplasma australiense TaxID=59748 RepID=B1VA49_PHYAS|nr:ATP-dependent Zn protease [Candidatus Phytoplasma australiense]